MIQKNYKLSVRRQCKLLKVQRTAVYYDPAKPSPEQVQWEEQLMVRIDYWHTTMPYLGVRRIVSKLKAEGYPVGRKLVRRLMNDMSIQAIYPKVNTSKRNFKDAIVPYLLRNKVVWLPNQVWSIDITYIKMHHGHMYLTTIIDWLSRMIVGWNLSDALDTGSVIQAVQSAILAHGCPGILNSDQGCQFTSSEYKVLLQTHHIRQGVDGKSRWADNIMIERWFRSLKTEEIYINEYRTPRALRQAIGTYIQQYNTVRPHQALDYATPEAVYHSCFASSTAGLDSLPLIG